jgi:hypothetical protein
LEALHSFQNFLLTCCVADVAPTCSATVTALVAVGSSFDDEPTVNSRDELSVATFGSSDLVRPSPMFRVGRPRPFPLAIGAADPSDADVLPKRRIGLRCARVGRLPQVGGAQFADLRAPPLCMDSVELFLIQVFDGRCPIDSLFDIRVMLNLPIPIGCRWCGLRLDVRVLAVSLLNSSMPSW